MKNADKLAGKKRIMATITRAAFIGFGEAAQAFLVSWGDKAPEVISGFDIKSNHAQHRESILLEYIKHGVQGAFEAHEAINGAELVFSLVTADQAEAVAKNVAKTFTPKQIFLDCNSCSPQVKQRNAELIEACGASYLDVVIMAPVSGRTSAIPLLISGKKALEIEPLLTTLGFNVEVVSDQVGEASSIKMIRSVMVKGLEALTTECLLAARKAGVENHVLESLSTTYPALPLNDLGQYHLERMLSHGERRSNELKEVSNTLSELNLNGSMVNGAMEWHSALGKMPVEYQGQDLSTLSDLVLGQLANTRTRAVNE
ncbi:DUF1932 domain-containing protein [Vibrio sp. 1CM2L]|uniref:DUF1932 domain-containing protein n=1 Tax=Vibrio sp. 1CM2L TaxID=2929166 RepID=UPI0020C0E7AD|nr:DUF1932 domain-containing protein [Vibrio sp. 1CM2L]MCK8075670.1 DUF1932 domain-containing protein [Vibrio sp. 1CM2L]